MTERRFAPTTIVVAGCLIAMIGFGVRSSFGLFNEPMTTALGWSFETYGLALAIQNLVWGAMTPIAGAFADKYGSSRVLMAGAVVYGLGVAAMANATSPVLLHLSGGVLVGTGIATASFGIVMAAFGRLVPAEKRSWAFGIATAASSMGQFVFAPLGQGFISAFGWQNALYLLAATLVLVLPLAIPLHAKGGVAQGERERELGFSESMAKAFGHTSYLLLVAGFFVCGFQLAFITVHMPNYLTELGISPWLAAFSIALVGMFNVVGSYSAGLLGNRYHKPYSLSFIYLGRSLAIAVFLLLPISTGSVILFAATMGLLWLSTVPLTMGLVTVMFGTRYMATLYGFVFFSHQVGSFFGVWLGGRFRDLYGSYDLIWWVSVALGLFAAIVHWPIAEKRAPAFAT